jgi:hypothetical protein
MDAENADFILNQKEAEILIERPLLGDWLLACINQQIDFLTRSLYFKDLAFPWMVQVCQQVARVSP